MGSVKNNHNHSDTCKSKGLLTVGRNEASAAGSSGGPWAVKQTREKIEVDSKRGCDPINIIRRYR